MTDPKQQVVDYRPRTDVRPAPAPGPEWDGRHTRFVIGWGRYLDRDHRVLGEGDAVEFAASEGDGGRWLGPDAKEVARNIRSGLFAGTPEHDAFRRAREANESEWGVHGGGRDGQPLRPDLRTPTKEEFLDYLSRADPRFGLRLKNPALVRQHEDAERGDLLTQLRTGLGGQVVQDGGTVSMADLSDEDLEAVLERRQRAKDAR